MVCFHNCPTNPVARIVFHKTEDGKQWRSYLREIIVQSKPSVSLGADPNERTYERYERVLPALVVPVKQEDLALDDFELLVSQDLSDLGISLLSNDILDYQHLVVGLWHDNRRAPSYEQHDPIFVLGEKKSCKSIGGGFLQTGVRFKQLYEDREHLDRLRSLADNLLPYNSPDADLHESVTN